MGLFDFWNKKSNIKDIVNVDKIKRVGSSISKRVTTQQLFRVSADVNKWRRALNFAENNINPDRTELLRIYKDVVLDPHLSSVMDQRVNKVLAHGFKVVDKEGAENEDLTNILKSAWFEKFLKLSMDSKFYGFTLMEFDSLINDAFKEITVLPREHVCPEKDIVFINTGRGNGINYLDKPWSNFVIFVGEKTDLGLLNKAAPIILWKRLVMATWAEFNELYGIPLRIGKTDGLNDIEKSKMEDMLENLGSSAWGLFNKEDEIEIINGNTGSGSDTFERFIDLADAQISKLIVGQTMTTDNGSSRSQSEVHAETLASYTGADMRWISYVVNNQLIPFLNDKGLAFNDLKFEWDNDEKLSLSEQFEIDSKLMEFFTVDPEYITNTYGTPVEVKEIQAEPTPGPQNGITVMNDVASMYKGFFKHEDTCTCGNC